MSARRWLVPLLAFLATLAIGAGYIAAIPDAEPLAIGEAWPVAP